MNKSLVHILCFFTFFSFLQSCSNNPLDVDVDDIVADVEFERFDQDFYAMSANPSFSAISPLDEKYSGFFEIYNSHVISCGSANDMAYYDCLRVFFADYSVVEAHNAVNNEFAECSDIQKDINDGFRHLLYYFPNEKLPRVVTFIAGFNQSIVICDGYIGVGLDKYLGNDCKLYDLMQIPDFAKNEMVRQRIAIDIFEQWFCDRFPYSPANDNLLCNIIYNGVKLYFLEAMFPKYDEELRLSYSSEELEFCQEYENKIWTTLVENNYLFNNDSFTIKKFTENAPFTAQFGPDSPARVANWIGLQIVKSYIRENNVSLVELLQTTDYQQILNLSGYNPK